MAEGKPLAIFSGLRAAGPGWGSAALLATSTAGDATAGVASEFRPLDDGFEQASAMTAKKAAP
jgi:hypothetical protein